MGKLSDYAQDAFLPTECGVAVLLMTEPGEAINAYQIG
jgi:hypothetical protein